VSTPKPSGKAIRIEPAARDWRGIFVTVRYPDRPDDPPMERLAMFALDLPRGRTVWIEGSYADPYGWPSPSSHEVHRLREVAPLRSAGPALEGTSTSADWTAVIEPYRRGLREDFDRALAWFEGYLRDQGRTWDEEREQVRLSFEEEL
jgi:hypothetical protein